MKFLITFIFVLLFAAVLAVVANAQTDLPIKGKLSDLKGKKSVYIVAETTESSELIEKILSKSFTIADDAEKADFIIEFKPIEKSTPPRYGAGAYTDIAEMTAYFYNAEKRKVVAWSQTKDAFKKGWGLVKKNETYLSNEFLKAFKKL